MGFRQFIKDVAYRWDGRRELALYGRYRDMTMIRRLAFVENLRIAQRAEPVPGSVVECGTWKGGMSAALAEMLPNRQYVLFDSFEGLPPAKEIDGAAAQRWQADTSGPEYYDNCRASITDAEESMRRAGVRARIVQGLFDATVPAFAAESPSIALLRLDGDWYDSTIVCLRELWPLVAPGGVVIIDDYGTWDGCTRAVHDFLSEVGAVEPIQRGRYGVAYMVRVAHSPPR